MNNVIIGIVLFATALSGCSLEKDEVSLEKPDLEMEVINDVLPELIPDDFPCTVMPAKGDNESRLEFENRLKEYYKMADSIGKNIEIVNVLTSIDSSFIDSHYRPKKLMKSLFLANMPDTDRTIDSTMIRKIPGIHIHIKKMTGHFDCFTLGGFTFSRVGFSHDYQKASLHYTIHDGTCFLEHGVIRVALKKGKWQIIKKEVY